MGFGSGGTRSMLTPFTDLVFFYSQFSQLTLLLEKLLINLVSLVLTTN